MTTINDYFEQVIVINRDARTYRWEKCVQQFRQFDLVVKRFSAYDHAKIDGYVGGNSGCTASHRAVLDLIAFHQWKRVLILEDDFKILHSDFQQRFSDMIGEVPEDASMIY